MPEGPVSGWLATIDFLTGSNAFDDRGDPNFSLSLEIKSDDNRQQLSPSDISDKRGLSDDTGLSDETGLSDPLLSTVDADDKQEILDRSVGLVLSCRPW
jgi:hypothetical protein